MSKDKRLRRPLDWRVYRRNIETGIKPCSSKALALNDIIALHI